VKIACPRNLLVLLLFAFLHAMPFAAAAAAQDHTDVVAAVKAALVARGVDLSGPCGAFEITGRVAYVLRGEGWGLVAKSPAQNGCSVPGHERYAVDAVMKPDGTTIDLLVNAETENRPAWQPTGAAATSSWRAPFAMDLEVPPPPTNLRVVSQ
jgi:hypothetical protein